VIVLGVYIDFIWEYNFLNVVSAIPNLSSTSRNWLTAIFPDSVSSENGWYAIIIFKIERKTFSNYADQDFKYVWFLSVVLELCLHAR